jgi:hypothetical protein
MIVLLAAGIGVCIVGLLAIGFGIPISDTSFGNAMLIAGVVILCTGIVLLGMWLAAREMANLLMQREGAQPVREPAPPPRTPTLFPGPASVAAPAAAHSATADGGPPPWADEAAARTRPQAVAPEIPPVAPEPPPPAPPPPGPDRPARRNLLFSSRRREKEEQPSLPSPALEAEPKVSFENAWPSTPRANGAAEPAAASASEPAAAEPAKPDLPPGVTVMKSGVVDGMAYTLYSDGSIEAQFAGEAPIRFASFDALRAHVEQQRQ